MTNDREIVELLASGRLRADAERGLVFAPRSNCPGKPCGARTKKGYLRICVNVGGRQRHFMAHRVIWVSVHGPLPEGHEVDHRNRAKDDNRIANLEAVPGQENMKRATNAGAFAHVGRRDGVRDEKGRFGKRAAGRLLDGREWNGMPGAARRNIDALEG